MNRFPHAAHPARNTTPFETCEQAVPRAAEKCASIDVQAGRVSDREGFRDGIRRLYAAFPDFRAVVEDVMVEAATGKVAIRWSDQARRILSSRAKLR